VEMVVNEELDRRTSETAVACLRTFGGTE
jgi:hypothetical protein